MFDDSGSGTGEILGWALIVTGAALLVFGLVYDPSIPSDGFLGERIVNMSKVVDKLMLFGGGCTGFVSGLVVLLTSQTRSAIAALRRESARAEAEHRG